MTVRILHGDSLKILPTLESESIDACVTDPPYGIGFMSKAWDVFKPGSGPKVTPNRGDSDNPNVKGRVRSPAASPSSVSYDETLSGHRRFQAWTEQWAREVYRVLKPGAHLLCFGAPRSYHRMACGIEDAGFDVRDSVLWIFGQGYPKSHNLRDENGEKNGLGTALKPAWEACVVARKPFKGTVAANVAAHGVGALNIDACRVAAPEGSVVRMGHFETGAERGYDGGLKGGARVDPQTAGRWPANVIHDGSPCVVEGFPAEAGAAAPVYKRNGDKSRGTYGAFAGDVDEQGSTFQGDSGSAARFFYVPKADRADRDDGMHQWPDVVTDVLAGHRSRRMEEVKRPDGQPPAIGRNIHPTVKPTDLMRYLCALVTPPGGLILDPFMGSGSTGRGAVLGGFRFIGVEREAEYVAIAKARIRAISPLFTEVS